MLTYQNAKDEVEFLLNYISLIENHKIESIEDLIIYEYAIYNSISKVIKNIKSDNKFLNFNFYSVTPSFVKDVIMSTPKNELHKVIRKQYLIKTRPQRRRSSNY